MATTAVRDLPDDVQRRLKQRADANGRLMEAAARAVISAPVAEPGFGTTWLEPAANNQGEALVLPARSAARDVGLS